MIKMELKRPIEEEKFLQKMEEVRVALRERARKRKKVR